MRDVTLTVTAACQGCGEVFAGATGSKPDLDDALRAASCHARNTGHEFIFEGRVFPRPKKLVKL